MAHALNAAQRAYVRRAARADAATATSETEGELNVVPFLDIVTNVTMFILATIATAFTAQISIRPHSACAPCTEHAPMAVTVHAMPEGYLVAVDGAFIQADCSSAGAAAVTVPLVGGQHDAAGLSRCLLTLRQSPAFRDGLAHQRGVQVSSRGELPYGVLIRTLDAARESRPGAGDLFPDAQLGMVH